MNEIIVHSGTASPIYNMPSLEDPSNALTGDWSTYNATAGAKLPYVTPSTALAIGAVWQAINIISGDLAKLPIHLYDKSSGHPTPVQNSQSEMLLCFEPNGGQRAKRFWRDFWVDYLLWNNAYIYPEKTARGVVALHHLRSWDTYAIGTNNDVTGDYFYQTRTPVTLNPQRVTATIPGREIIHLEGVNPYTLPGTISTIDTARVLLGLMLADQSYQAAFFRNGGRNGGVLEVSGVMKPEQLQELVAAFRSVYETPDGFGKTLFTKMGESKFHQGSVTSAETVRDASEATATVEATSQVFNLPLHKLTNRRKYNSKPEDNRDYIEQTLSPLQAAITCELQSHLIPRTQWFTHYFEYANDELIKGDLFTTSQTIGLLRRNEIISANEGRGMIGRPPRTDPDGDSFSNPNTKTQADKGETESQEQMANLTPYRVLLHNAVERVIRVRQKAKRSPEEKATGAVELLCDEIEVIAVATGRSADEIRQGMTNTLAVLFAAKDADFDKQVERTIHEIQGSVFG